MKRSEPVGSLVLVRLLLLRPDSQTLKKGKEKHLKEEVIDRLVLLCNKLNTPVVEISQMFETMADQVNKKSWNILCLSLNKKLGNSLCLLLL